MLIQVNQLKNNFKFLKNINVITLFPEYFNSLNKYSIIKNAINKDKISLNFFNLRDYSPYKSKSVDDYIYGGGPGMLLMVEPVYYAINAIKLKDPQTCIILLSPKGKNFNQNMAQKIVTNYKSITFICGHYEGFDKRVYRYCDLIISLGDFVTTGGETICAVILDSIIRLLPDVINKKSLQEETNLLDNFVEYDQYTRPEMFNGDVVPSILLNGNHQKINNWKKASAQINLNKKNKY